MEFFPFFIKFRILLQFHFAALILKSNTLTSMKQTNKQTKMVCALSIVNSNCSLLIVVQRYFVFLNLHHFQILLIKQKYEILYSFLFTEEEKDTEKANIYLCMINNFYCEFTKWTWPIKLVFVFHQFKKIWKNYFILFLLINSLNRLKYWL